MDLLEIYFNNLNEKTQKVVLDFYHVTTPEELNSDVIPLFVLNYESDETLYG